MSDNGFGFDINKLRVASPCSVGWDNMTGDERTRHCSLCSLNVFNVSSLTTAEVADLVQKREGRLCIRMYRRADGTVLTRDCPVGLRALRKRVASFAGAAFASVLGLFSISFGQKADQKESDAPKVKIMKTVAINGEHKLTGAVLDKFGAAIAFATVRLLSIDGGETVTTSNGDGLFSYESVRPGIYSLTIMASGFQRRQLNDVAVGLNEDIELTIKMNFGERLATVGLIAAPEPPLETTTVTPTLTTLPRKLEKPHR